MKVIISRKAFTLVEVIVAIALLGILCLVLLSMFTFGYKLVMSEGRRGIALFKAQENVETTILANPTGIDEIDIVVPNNPSLNLKVEGKLETITVPFKEGSVNQSIYIRNQN